MRQLEFHLSVISKKLADAENFDVRDAVGLISSLRHMAVRTQRLEDLLTSPILPAVSKLSANYLKIHE